MRFYRYLPALLVALALLSLLSACGGKGGGY
jgi:predicted small lipoprotein YifL